jgi:hypothetical protein
MIENTAFQCLPQSSTVIGLGILAGTLCYLITGDAVWAGVAAAAIQILVTDNSMGGDQVFAAIAMLASAAGRPLQAPTAQPPVASGAPGIHRGLLFREALKNMTSDRTREQG